MLEQKDKNTKLDPESFLYGANAAYIEQLYAQYEENPQSVNEEWQNYFSSLAENKADVIKSAAPLSWQKSHWPISACDNIIAALDGNWDKIESQAPKKDKNKPIEQVDNSLLLKAINLIDSYRNYGHLKANIDPLSIKKQRKYSEQLEISNFGLKETDLNSEVNLNDILGLQKVKIADLIKLLEKKYCGNIGIEFAHITDKQQRNWLRDNFEKLDLNNIDNNSKKSILDKLNQAEGFENFLDAKYKGAKRFGLDGGESLIPALFETLKSAAKLGIEQVVMGMAHRGRLNVLANILHKPYRAIFHEFMGGSYKPDDIAGSGDVKYHLGYSKDYNFDGKNLHISLLPNPSHLEIVNPVTFGNARAKQDIIMNRDNISYVDSNLSESDLLQQRSRLLPILLHGDAAFSGQGIVQEVLAASSIKGYSVAGSLHVIINNQVGFTTDPECSRSTNYSSDVAKMIDAPIIHVNGDDTEAVVKAMNFALLYRQNFKKPFIIDMYCYRRFGHNEGDEPSFTQPLMYKIIRSHPSVGKIYSEKLTKENIITTAEYEELKNAVRKTLDEEFEAAKSHKVTEADWLKGQWHGLKSTNSNRDMLFTDVKTGVDLLHLKSIAEKLITLPENFNLHKTIKRFIEQRSKMLESGQGLDWAMAEALAFGSLLLEGHSIRLSGEDVERGTFSQRHSVVYDQDTKAKYTPLNNLQPNQKAKYEAVNSLLSEEGVLGYEYGYSLAQPHSLVLWEAQFGDFANGAQVVFDQFISSAETKWLRMSGLVCLLPHGFEGQGPEHSSARLERFLQLCAEDNMQVANCTTPANYFHILRRQLKREFRKPLIMMTPKSLLRHKRAQSSLDELALDSSFKPVLLDTAETMPNEVIKLQKDSKIRKVILCSGKVYYDLYEEREKRGINDIYLLRVEQLYPFPAQQVIQVISRFAQAEIIWCQEEPKNMGAWRYIEPYLENALNDINAKYKRAKYIGRPSAASPSVGMMSEHLKQLAEFLEYALA